MFSTCPRCDSHMLDSMGNCSNCGYTLRVTCNECGFKNIPLAKYCGSCGEGLTLKIRLVSHFNRNISYLSQIKVKKFAAGLAFGSLLGVFAFGSMGMHSEVKIENRPKVFAYQNNAYSTEFNSSCLIKELTEFRNARAGKKVADYSDIRKFTEIMVKNLSSAANMISQENFDEKDVPYYISKIRNFSKGGLCRGSATILLFNMASEMLNLSYRDFSDECKFKDIPRFHFLSVPVSALSSLGINMERNSEEFGIADSISIEQLFQSGLGLANASEIRMKQKVFFALQPR